MDLSKLSTEDLQALKSGDLSKVSTQGLQYLKGQAAMSVPQPSYDPSEGGGTLQIGPFDTGIKTPQALNRFLSGAGKAYTDVGRGVGQLLGLVNRDDVAESRRLDAPLMATTAGKVGNLTGNVALTAPVALVPGANTIAGGAAVGAVTGLLQPSTSSSETLRNVLTGGVAGAAVPAAVRGYKLAKAAAEPFYDAGKNAIVGRALNAAAGSDADNAIQRLASAQELVPGSVPTVGQASGNAGVAALERAATATNPEITNAMAERMAAQNTARVSALQDLAGEGGKREFFTTARDATADQMYDAARRLGVDSSKLSPDVLQNIANFSQRIPDAVLNKAKELAQISGEPMTDATSIQGLHWVKKGIDALIGQAQRSGDSTTVRALTGLQKDLLTGMDNLSPAYQAARQTFAQMSRPVNQMEVAADIANRSINPLSGNLQPNAFARALNDSTAARVTGMPSATLEGTFEPEQMNLLQSILQDVKRANAAQNAGRGVGSDTVQKLAYTNLLDQSGVPTFFREFAPTQFLGNVGSRVADAAYSRANRELSNRLAEVMLDPKAAAELMKNATPAQRNALLELVQRGASGLALSAPAAYAGQQ